MLNIPLANGKEALYITTRMSRVPDIDKDHDIPVHFYHAPCPVCQAPTSAFSYDGIFFANLQITCRTCGVFFRPAVDQQFAQKARRGEINVNA